jgi:type I restriction enzyme S subunit
MAANQAVLGLVPDPNRVEPRFLFHWLRSRKDSMRDRRSGSSQPNLNKETVIQEPVPVVELDRQRVVASVLDALSETSGNSSKVVAAAERARTALVADLLSGEHEIPESYDRFLEGAS